MSAYLRAYADNALSSIVSQLADAAVARERRTLGQDRTYMARSFALLAGDFPQVLSTQNPDRMKRVSKEDLPQ